MSTGIFIRVQRDGKGQSVELEQCTKAELITFFEAKDNPQELRNWLYLLVGYAAGSAEIIRGLERDGKRLDAFQKLKLGFDPFKLADVSMKTSVPDPANPPAPQSPPPAPADTADSQ